MAFFNQLLITGLKSNADAVLYTMDSVTSSSIDIIHDTDEGLEKDINDERINTIEPKVTNFDFNSNDPYHLKDAPKFLSSAQYNSIVRTSKYQSSKSYTIFPTCYLGNVFINRVWQKYDANYKAMDKYDNNIIYKPVFGNLIVSDHGAKHLKEWHINSYVSNTIINKIQGPSSIVSDNVIYMCSDHDTSKLKSDTKYNHGITGKIDILSNYSGVFFGTPEFSNNSKGNEIYLRMNDIDTSPDNLYDISLGGYFSVNPDYIDDEYDNLYVEDGQNEVWRPHLFGSEGRLDYSTSIDNTRVKWTIKWDDKKYADYTGFNGSGPSISDNNYTLEGWLMPTLYKYNKYQILAMSEQRVSYTISNPYSSTPVITYGGVEQSGYIATREIVIGCDSSPGEYEGVWLQKKLNDGTWKDIESKPDRHYNFEEEKNRQLLGNPIRAKVGYDFMGGNVYLYSNEVVPSWDNYYDIMDVTLALSGVRYDKPTASNITYNEDWIKSNGEQVIINSMDATFFTVSDVWATADFTLKANNRNMDGNIASYVPYPTGIWLVGVNYDTIFAQNATTKNTWMYINESFVNTKREKNGYQLAYPNINSTIANYMIDDLTGSPNVENTKGLVWNTYWPSIYYIDHNEGSFDENDYTITVKLGGGKYAVFVIIRDSNGWATAYCLTNPKDNYFDSPTKFKFQ